MEFVTVTKCTEINCFKVAGDRIFISMHLCNEYARSPTTHTDNMRIIYEKVPSGLLLPQ